MANRSDTVWTCPEHRLAELKTTRLVIRPWRPQDAGSAFDLVERSRGVLRKWMPWVDANRDRAACESTIERLSECHKDDRPEQLAYGIFERDSNAACGGAGFHTFRFETAQAQFGYWLDPGRRGEGLATEAAVALLDFALKSQSDRGLGLRRIEVRCAASNEGSRRVAERLGLRHEGTLRRERWFEDSGWDDGLVFGVLRDEWPTREAGALLDEAVV